MHDMAGWLILGAAAIVGSSIGGVAGFGTGVIMIPAIAWSVGVKATVPVLTVCMLVGNSARVWFSRHDIVWRVVGAFLVGAVPMTMLGATLYTRIDSVWLSRMTEKTFLRILEALLIIFGLQFVLWPSR